MIAPREQPFGGIDLAGLDAAWPNLLGQASADAPTAPTCALDAYG
jgi:hypothetical protein